MKRPLVIAGLLAGTVLAWRAGRRPTPLGGKVVIVTGASAGIGRATARAFARAGARVALVARRPGPLEAAREELAALGATCVAVAGDVSSPEDGASIVAAVRERLGPIDVLVNNAGLGLGGPIDELDAAALRRLVAVNVYGPIQLARLVVPEMRRRGAGHIVNVSSMVGLLTPPGSAAYAATRSAMIGFSDALRKELAGSGVRVSLVLPGWTRTGMLAAMDKARMGAAGMVGHGLSLDPPEVPARAIIRAVRYGRREVLLGGPLAILGGLAGRGLPWAIDAYYRVMFDADEMVAVMRDLGTS